MEGGRGWQAIEPALFWLLGLACILASIRWNDRLWRLFGGYARPIRFLGLATYPLYLVHSEVGEAIMLHASALGPFPALMLSFCAVLLLSFLIVKVEPYPRRWFGRLLSIRVRQQALVRADLPGRNGRDRARAPVRSAIDEPRI